MDFYVYLHRRATDGRVFYVGKGSGKRAHTRKNRNPHWHRTVLKHGFTVEFIQTGMLEWWALEMERELVTFYGRANLTNLTDGGEGAPNPSEETRRIMSAKGKLRKPSMLGVPMREETKRKLSLANKGHPSPCRGIPLKEETKRKISEAKKGKSNGHAGLKRSEQARLNMSLAQKSMPNRRDISGDKNPTKREDVKAKLRMPRESISRGKNPAARKARCLQTGEVFPSIADANDWLKSQGRKGSVKACLSGRSKTSGGYTWEYA